MRVTWEGRNPPTSAERRAIARAARAGLLFDGATVRPARMNPSGARAAEGYTRFHWGNKPRRVRRVRLPNYSELYALGRLQRVEYETRKGSDRATWVHDFSEPFPLLTATPSGELGPIVGGAAYVTERGIER